MKPVLCMVTDRRRLAPSGSCDELIECVGRAARAGVDLVQVREPGMEAGALTELVARCVEAVRGTRSRVLVNDRMDVALAARAHGVHLPADGVPPRRARLLAPAGFLIGRSVHDAAEAAGVDAEGGADYLVFGTVFATASKAQVAPAGLERLAAAVRSVRLPVLAIGGVRLEHAPAVARTGAAGIAAIGMFADACGGGIDRLPTVVAEWSRRW